jgi:hypothetical protein
MTYILIQYNKYINNLKFQLNYNAKNWHKQNQTNKEQNFGCKNLDENNR